MPLDYRMAHDCRSKTTTVKRSQWIHRVVLFLVMLSLTTLEKHVAKLTPGTVVMYKTTKPAFRERLAVIPITSRSENRRLAMLGQIEERSPDFNLANSHNNHATRGFQHKVTQEAWRTAASSTRLRMS
jgi:hypothetical protein